MLFNLIILEPRLQFNFPWPQYIFEWEIKALSDDLQYIAKFKIPEWNSFSWLKTNLCEYISIRK